MRNNLKRSTDLREICDPDETDGRRRERAYAEWRANADTIYLRRKVTYGGTSTLSSKDAR